MLRSRLLSAPVFAGLPGPIWLALLAAAACFAGGVWDVAWHRTIGRDTFWSPPHLLLYGGVSLGLLAGLWGVVAARTGVGATWRLGRWRPPLGYTLVVAGYAGEMLTAPVDDLWHVLYGRDVDIWSAPHLLAIACSAVATVGWITAVRPWLAPATGRQRVTCTVAYYFFAGILLYTAWFGFNWYHMVAASRDTLLYPSLAGLFMLPTLAAVACADRRGWPATTAAVAFMALAVLPIVVFESLAWRAPAWPPLLVVPAFAVDWLTREPRGRLGWRRVGALGAGFTVLFLGVELARMQLAPPVLPPLSARLEARVLGPYVAAAAARPWTPSSLLAALPLVVLASGAGAGVGRGLGRFWERAAGTAEQTEGTVDLSPRAPGFPKEAGRLATPRVGAGEPVGLAGTRRGR